MTAILDTIASLYNEGKSLRAIGKACGMTEGAAKAHTIRLRQKGRIGIRRKGWTDPEDAIVIAGFRENEPWPDLLAKLPGRKQQSIIERACRLRQMGVFLPIRVPAPNPIAKSERRVADLKRRAAVERRAREEAKQRAPKNFPAFGTRLFTDDPRAKLDTGSPRSALATPITRSFVGSSAGFAA